jgi:hypothetical protein
MSAVCPRCGSTDSRSRFGSLGSVRICQDCGRHFSLPTPMWERLLVAALFLVPGLVLGIAAIGIILLTLNHGGPNPGTLRGGLGCGGFLIVLAVLCLVQGFRELGGRVKKTTEAFGVESLEDESVKVRRQEHVVEAPPLVPIEQAESLVREIAEKHGAKGILRSLGHFRKGHLDNAASHFAHEMRDDETPLAFIDTSLLRNGKAGFLLTNRGLYSSFFRRPIWLTDIEDVSYARPGSLDFLTMYLLGGMIYLLLFGFKSLQDRLLVNGKVVYAGNRLRANFWIELLTELAHAAREMEDSFGGITTAARIVVLEITLSQREGESIEVKQIRDPSWRQLEQSIRTLDQDSHPSLRIWAGEVEQAPALDILGGNGKYVLRELGDGWVYYDPSQGEEEIEVCTGLPGHRAPAFYVCTDLNRVLQIARHYFETGTPE